MGLIRDDNWKVSVMMHSLDYWEFNCIDLLIKDPVVRKIGCSCGFKDLDGK